MRVPSVRVSLAGSVLVAALAARVQPLVKGSSPGALGGGQPLDGGCNIGGMDYYDTDLKTCDLVKMGSPFGNPQGPWKGNAALDNSTGWPVEDFSISG